MIHDRVITINATAFKAQCLDILARIATHKLSRVTITKRGRPVAVVEAPRPDEGTRASSEDAVPIGWGSMRGTIIVPRDMDLAALNDVAAPEPGADKFAMLHDRRP